MVSTHINRFNGWAALAVSSGVSLIFLLDHLAGKGESSGGSSYALGTILTSFLVALIVTGLHYVPSFAVIVVGTKVECYVSFALLVLWGVCIAIIQNPDEKLATESDEKGLEIIMNANLYFFSWLTFVDILYLTAANIHNLRGVTIQSLREDVSARIVRWSTLLVCSVIVFGCSIDLRRSACVTECSNEGDTDCYNKETCSRTDFAIAVGFLVSFISVLVMIMGTLRDLTFMMEAVGAAIILILYSFEVGFVTTSLGPGASLGNLYFSSWAGFLSSVWLLIELVKEFTQAAATVDQSEAIPTTDDDAQKDIQDEPIPQGMEDDI